MLAHLKSIKGVEKAYANRDGHLFRVTVAPEADLEEVVTVVSKSLGKERKKPNRLAGKEFDRALDKEEWRDSDRIGELTLIEYRILALRVVTKFAKDEEIDEEVAGKLVTIAEEEWNRLVKGRWAGESGAGAKIDWSTRRDEFASAVLNRANSLLTTAQRDRLSRILHDPPSATLKIEK